MAIWSLQIPLMFSFTSRIVPSNFLLGQLNHVGLSFSVSKEFQSNINCWGSGVVWRVGVSLLWVACENTHCWMDDWLSIFFWDCFFFFFHDCFWASFFCRVCVAWMRTGGIRRLVSLYRLNRALVRDLFWVSTIKAFNFTELADGLTMECVGLLFGLDEGVVAGSMGVRGRWCDFIHSIQSLLLGCERNLSHVMVLVTDGCISQCVGMAHKFISIVRWIVSVKALFFVLHWGSPGNFLSAWRTLSSLVEVLASNCYVAFFWFSHAFLIFHHLHQLFGEALHCSFICIDTCSHGFLRFFKAVAKFFPERFGEIF